MPNRSYPSEPPGASPVTSTILETLIESLPGVAYFYDAAGRFLRWNHNFEIVSGYSASEIARMHPLDFFAPADRPLIESRIAEVFERGESSVEAPFVSKDGTVKHYLFTGRRVTFEGRFCLAGMGVDIADRKRAEDRIAESERKYRELVEHANSIILRWSSDGRITFLNEFGQQFFGYTEEEIVGRHVMDTIVPPTESGGRDLARLMEDVLATPESYGHNINENMRRSGERVWIAWTNRIVRDKDGRIVELLSIGTDVTQRRQLEAQLRQAQKMEAIGLLAGGVAHDFNNILAAIQGNIQLAIADTAPNHPARESLEEIKKATARATSLVQQILCFSRHHPHKRRAIDLRVILDEAERFLRATIPAIVELDFAVDDSVPAIMGDATQVYQVIANLCTNAWHSLDGRPGHVEVTLEPVELDPEAATRVGDIPPGLYACLSVTDDGRGMDAATRDRIFEPFFTTKEDGSGTGLGLAVVHGIMRGHNGGITVNSHPDRGTTFRAYFPTTSAIARPEPAPMATAVHGEGEHILYLDDEEPLVFLATRMLKRLGYRISGFTDADDARRAFRQNPHQFDMVITDFNMPGIAGIDFAVELRRRRPDLPVVLCSGHVTDELRERARDVGITEVLYKPSTMEEFSDTIHRLITDT